MKALFNPLHARLRAKGLPTAIEFTYGQPQVPAQVGATRIYMCSDDDAGDTIGAARSQKPNPVGVGINAVGLKFVIFAHDTRGGADIAAHELLARQLSNMLTAALHYVVRQSRTLHEVGRGRFVPIENSDAWAGRRYEVPFSVDTRIEDLTWKGAAAPEVSAPSTTTTFAFEGAGTSTDLPHATTRIE